MTRFIPLAAALLAASVFGSAHAADPTPPTA